MKPTPGQDAERQAHEVVHHERVGVSSGHWKQKVDLNHGDGRIMATEAARQTRSVVRSPAALPCSVRL